MIPTKFKVSQTSFSILICAFIIAVAFLDSSSVILYFQTLFVFDNTAASLHDGKTLGINQTLP